MMENLIHMACTIKTVKLFYFPPCQQCIICFIGMLKRLLLREIPQDLHKCPPHACTSYRFHFQFFLKLETALVFVFPYPIREDISTHLQELSAQRHQKCTEANRSCQVSAAFLSWACTSALGCNVVHQLSVQRDACLLLCGNLVPGKLCVCRTVTPSPDYALFLWPH